ncbi:MAG: DNA polymerase III subunit gamma/tau [Candidatus Levybacteria bacterium]|nr:DNA polymerase III subunit gamma/tau [Candidatus Levybacteria bacterium]
MVFYRKYRPQKIEELDSKEVRDKLHSVLGSSSVSHAFLFTGPKGLGKTSAARIVAKVLNCEKVRNEKGEMKNKDKTSHLSSLTSHFRAVEPCNKCEQCISITRGTNLDVLEIDGASNRGIDEIRDLREKVKLSPAGSRKKVYIIDEVHMLTAEAFNALLKTLEEPPSHVVFILCTTEPHKVPSTILSRCLHIQFRKATEAELVRSFERIIKAEKIKADKEALDLIASLSDGSFRDGSKLLEEIALLAGRKKIAKELIEEKYYVSSIKYHIRAMVKCLDAKDTKGGLELVSKLTEQGIDMKFFIEELIQTLHSLLLQKVGIKNDQELEVQILDFDINGIKRLVELFAKAHSELKYAVLPQIPLELVIVEWGIQKTQNTQQSGNSDNQTIRPASPKLPPRLGEAGQRGEQSDSPSIQKMVKAQKNEIPLNVAQQNMMGYSENNALWVSLIDRVKAYNHSIAGVLRGCRIKSYDGKSLIIEANFKFHKDKLGEIKTQQVLEEACKEITKKNVKVEVMMKPAVAKALAGDGR